VESWSRICRGYLYVLESYSAFEDAVGRTTDLGLGPDHFAFPFGFWNISGNVTLSHLVLPINSNFPPSFLVSSMGSILESEKIVVEINKHTPSTVGTEDADSTSQLGLMASAENHNMGKLASFRKYPWACAWCIYTVWVVLLVSFENQAAGNVIGIPEFRKDFGKEFVIEHGKGEVKVTYLIDAHWQSAFQGAPVAS
jgi:hypothetical protein